MIPFSLLALLFLVHSPTYTMSPPPLLNTILCERISDGVVLLPYNTPKRSNAFDPQQYFDLKDELDWAHDEEAVNVVVAYTFPINILQSSHRSRARRGNRLGKHATQRVRPRVRTRPDHLFPDPVYVSGYSVRGLVVV